MNYLVIGASLNPQSRSQRMARELVAMVESAEPGAGVELLDLRKLTLPLCDGNAAYDDPGAVKARQMVANADGLILTGPVYNYYLNAAAKNLIELTGRAWTGKVVGFVCSAGGQSSYMSVMELANELMLDFRCHILPRFVYTTGGAFEGEKLTDPAIRERLEQLAAELVRVTRALRD